MDLKRIVENLPQSITHVLFSDGSDSLLLAGEEPILSAFHDLGGEFVISMERGCWPVVDDPAWRESFPPAVDGRRWPNAGGWMGTRYGVLTVLDECIALYEQLKGDGLKGELARWQKHSKYAHDDQWLLQLAFQNKRVPMIGDSRHQLFTNVGTASRKLIHNPDYTITRNEVRSKATDTRPLVIHFSGGAWRECQEQWMARLGYI